MRYPVALYIIIGILYSDRPIIGVIYIQRFLPTSTFTCYNIGLSFCFQIQRQIYFLTRTITYTDFLSLTWYSYRLVFETTLK